MFPLPTGAFYGLAELTNFFCESGVAKMACNGLKKGSFHLFRHPKWCRIIFGKTHFDPFLTHFSSQNNPFSRHFWDFWRAKTGHHELKARQKHLFWHSMWSRVVAGGLGAIEIAF